MSTTVVTPPLAAARVPLACVSQPNPRKVWKCWSMTPGRTVRPVEVEPLVGVERAGADGRDAPVADADVGLRHLAVRQDDARADESQVMQCHGMPPV